MEATTNDRLWLVIRANGEVGINGVKDGQICALRCGNTDAVRDLAERLLKAADYIEGALGREDRKGDVVTTGTNRG